MKVLIKSATVLSTSHPSYSTDILIENGIITKLNKNIKTGADKTIEIENLCISIGWMDCFANFCDPGYEYKETLETGASSAAAGGFTEVMVIPNTNPALHSKTQIDYIRQKSKSLPVHIHPIGAITKNAEGKELCEMYDMRNFGAIAFSDGLHSLQSSGIMLKALEYLKAIDATIIQLPDDKNIASHGLMNEGITSVKLGLPGKPAISEEILIARDINLLKYTNSKIHFTGISTKKSLELIKAARAEGFHVSCSVTPHHLFFSDEDLTGYDTNLKTNPPLRTKEDVSALTDGVKNGDIDFIASHHQPQHWDDKTCEFEAAKYGMIGLESMFGVIQKCGISTELFVKMQTKNIRSIFNLPVPEFKEGAKANLTLFKHDIEYTFSEKNLYSKSRNTPFAGRRLKGKSFGIINGEKLFLSERHLNE